jgi:hypothetical protein
MLGWDAGNFHLSASLFLLAPTGDYSTRQLANTSLNRWRWYHGSPQPISIRNPNGSERGVIVSTDPIASRPV